MKRIILLLSLLFSLSYASITLQGVSFTDTEENASTYLITYYPYQTFLDMKLSSGTPINAIMNCRNNKTPSLSCISPSCTAPDLMRIREYSYLIDWSLVTNSLGINQRAYVSIMGVLGALIGFTFAFFLIYTVVNISRNKA